MRSLRIPTAHQVARTGEYFVAAELHRRGAYAVPFADNMPGIDLLASNIDQTRMVTIQVKAKRAGSWQTRASRGSPRAEVSDERRFWIFVDLEGEPAYYVVPEWWIQNDIHQAHAAYLARHGGHRAINPSSDHHSIQRTRILSWRDRWVELGLF
jgi:hypothetical protein